MSSNYGLFNQAQTNNFFQTTVKIPLSVPAWYAPLVYDMALNLTLFTVEQNRFFVDEQQFPNSNSTEFSVYNFYPTFSGLFP